MGLYLYTDEGVAESRWRNEPDHVSVKYQTNNIAAWYYKHATGPSNLETGLPEGFASIYNGSKEALSGAIDKVLFYYQGKLSITKNRIKVLEIKQEAFYKPSIRVKEVFSQSDVRAFCCAGILCSVSR